MPDVSAKKLCFVVGPIGDEDTDIRDHADWLLDGIIRPVMATFHDFHVKRADHDARPGLIDVQMINDLLNAELVIADLSLLNPNAFYEIGIRHMTQKPIIHMQLATEGTPFDVSLYRAIKFARTRFSDVEKAKDDLKNFVDAVLDSAYQPENPVTNAVGRLQLEQNATPEMRVMMEEMDRLKTQVNMLQELIVGQPSPLEKLWVLNNTPTAGNAVGVLTGTVPNVLSSHRTNIPPVGNLEGNAISGWRTRGS